MRKLPWAQDFLKEQEVVVPDASALAGAWKQTLKRAELHVEIGTGKGDYWVQMAQKYPDIAWVGVEKNINVAALAVRKYTQLEQQPDNMLYIQGDAEVIDTWFAQGEVDVIHLNFPDPWHKKRHHKRRLIQPPFVAKLLPKLKVGGYIHLATDWEEYAVQMLEVLSSFDILQNIAADYAPTPAYRPETKFEARGRRLGHGVWDLVFTRVA